MREERMLGTVAIPRYAHHRTDSQWLSDAWPGARLLMLDGDRTLVVDEVDGPVLALGDTANASLADAFLLSVGSDDVPIFAVVGTRRPRGAQRWAGLREVGGYLRVEESALFTHAVGLAHWHQKHIFCGRCGDRTRLAAAGHLRCCTGCGLEHYPRTDPAVIVLITDDDDRALLGHGNGWRVGGFSTLAGFVEPGESLEQAVAREMYEEVGLAVSDIRYIASQPWPFPSSLMVGFRARANGSPAVDGIEVDDARWFTRQELSTAVANGSVSLSARLSIARLLIDDWLTR